MIFDCCNTAQKWKREIEECGHFEDMNELETLISPDDL